MATGRRGLLGLAAAGLTGGGLVWPSLAAARPNALPPPPPPNIVVDTHRGKVRGSSDGEIKVFRGIPYAAATQGANRFHPPRLAKNWSGVRDAVAYGPMCPQLPQKRGSYTASWTYDKDAGEDCLVLNVWTPTLHDQRRRPVMVWLHGGGFSAESGS